MSGEVHGFDPNNTALSIATVPMRGIDKSDTAIRFGKMMPDYQEPSKGLDGSSTANKDPDNTWKLELDLMQASPSNDELSALRTADRRLPGVIFYPGLFTDKNGTTIYAWTKATVSEVPKGTIGQKAGIRTWIFIIHDMVDHVGGNGISLDVFTSILGQAAAFVGL